MKTNKFSLTIIAVLINVQSFSQCNWEWHDSLRRNKDWNFIKTFFVPKDINKYPLILEDLTIEQQSNGKSIQSNYYARHDNDTLTKCDHLNGNVTFNWDDEKIQKRFKKYYTGNYKIVNIDSIDFLSKTEYPYVLMYYSETTELDKDGHTPLVSRHGYYIWDRRLNYKYPVYSCLGAEEDKIFFTNLNK